MPNKFIVQKVVQERGMKFYAVELLIERSDELVASRVGVADEYQLVFERRVAICRYHHLAS